jgi:hypothetical protein
VSRTQLSLPPEAVARLIQLLIDLAAVPGIHPEHQYELAYSRDQVREHLPAIEGLVIAGLLYEAPERLALDPGTQAACRWWSAALIQALTGSASTPPRKAAAHSTQAVQAGPPTSPASTLPMALWIPATTEAGSACRPRGLILPQERCWVEPQAKAAGRDG